MSAPSENQSDARCPYCGCATPEPGMRCRDRAMCAQRADYTYITDALGIKGAREGASPSAPARTGTDRNAALAADPTVELSESAPDGETA